VYFARCAGTPPTTAATFQVGAILIQTDGVAGKTTWINTGSTAVPVWNALSGSGSLLKQQALSTANILGMYASPITIVAAGGAGTVIDINDITLKMVTTATQFASGGAVTFQYAGGNAVTNSIASTVVTAGAGTSYTSRAGIDVTASVNTAVTVTNGTGAFTTGTGTGQLTIDYKVITP
jgi:hypothetical protein